MFSYIPLKPLGLAVLFTKALHLSSSLWLKGQFSATFHMHTGTHKG